jgi:hypothetical protein
MRTLRSQSIALVSGVLVAGAVFAQAIPLPTDPAHKTYQVPPKPPACWSMFGPRGSGRETHFDAANNCEKPMHCRVWINLHEPPFQIHLEAGTSGRIEIGEPQAGDKYSFDCVYLAPGML